MSVRVALCDTVALGQPVRVGVRVGDSVGLPLPHPVTARLADWLSESVGVPVAVLTPVITVRVTVALPQKDTELVLQRVTDVVTVELGRVETVGEALVDPVRVGDRLPVRLAVAVRTPVIRVRVTVLVRQLDKVRETVGLTVVVRLPVITVREMVLVAQRVMVRETVGLTVAERAPVITVRVMVLIALRDVVRETVGQAVAVRATVMTVRETVLVPQFDRVRETEVVRETVGLEVRLAVITVRVTVLVPQRVSVRETVGLTLEVRLAVITVRVTVLVFVLQLDKDREPVGEAEKDTSASVLGRDARSAAAVSSGAGRDIARACERPRQAGLWQKQRQAMIKRSVVMLQPPARRE